VVVSTKFEDPSVVIRSLIRTIPDYPKPGIMFRDITTLLQHPRGFRTAVDALVDRYTDRGVDCVAGIEARGFILAAPVAHQLGVGFVPIRKRGKLPHDTLTHEYELEYGTDAIEVHTDAFVAGQQVLLIDDLIATGGTAEAAVHLVRKSGGSVVECAFVIDLPEVGGRARLEKQGLGVFALCAFEGE